MNPKVKSCFDLTVQIEDLTQQRDALEGTLSDGERDELIALLDQAGEAKLNEAANLQAFRDVKRMTDPEIRQ
jgi:hypothetical protein